MITVTRMGEREMYKLRVRCIYWSTCGSDTISYGSRGCRLGSSSCCCQLVDVDVVVCCLLFVVFGEVVRGPVKGSLPGVGQSFAEFRSEMFACFFLRVVQHLKTEYNV